MPKTQIESGLIARVSGAVRGMVNGWMSPGDPMRPVVPGQQPRALDYAPGINITPITKTKDPGAVEYSQLRALADSCTGLRAVIETRKDSIAKLRFNFVVRAKPGESKTAHRKRSDSDSRVAELTTFFEFPDGEHDWSQWLRMILEDAIVIDAPAITARKFALNALPASLDVLDGATISRVITATGRTPTPPATAYQQVIQGAPIVDFTVPTSGLPTPEKEELLFLPRNLRAHRYFGYSPVEQLIVYVNIALRRTAFQLFHYTEGNMPVALMRAPKEWGTQQIKEMNEIWNAMLAGNVRARSRALWIPEAGDPIFPQKENLKDEFDEWLMRMICYVFSVSPNIFIKQQNRASSESYLEQMEEEGLLPWLQYVKVLIDNAVRRWWGYEDVEFEWNYDKELDQLKQAQIDQIYLGTSPPVITPNEVRARLGYEPLTTEQIAELTAMRQQLSPIPEPGEEEEETTTPFGKIAKRRLLRRRLRNEKVIAERSRRFQKKVLAVLREKLEQTKAHLRVEKLEKADADAVLRGLTFDWSEFEGDLRDELEDVYANAFGQLNDRAREWAEERAAEMVKAIDDTTREDLRAAVSRALEEGKSPAQLAEELEDLYGFSASRAETIAITEITEAQTHGALADWEEAGVTGKRWIVDGDPCEVCIENAEAGVIPLDELFPSGDDAPAAHPHCKCDVVPEFVEKMEKAYDPDQPRDEDGRWSYGDGVSTHEPTGNIENEGFYEVADEDTYHKLNDMFYAEWETDGDDEGRVVRDGGRIKEVDVDLDQDLIASQDSVSEEGVERYMSDFDRLSEARSSSDGAPPSIIKIHGRKFVLDGHHRISAARRLERSKIRALYFDADKAASSQK